MDYEKKYNEALERAKMYHRNANEAGDYSAVARYENIFPELRESKSEDERIRKALINILNEYKTLLVNESISSEQAIAYLEKQKGNQYFAGYFKGYSEGQLNSKQQEIPMPNSTELIEMWDKEEAMLREKDFRGDTWRIAYNAFMDGFARGTCVKFEKPDIEICPHSIKSKSYKEQNPISQEDFDTAKHEATWGEQKPLEMPSPSVIYTEQGDVLAEQEPASTEDMPYIADEHFYERAPADSFKYKLAEYMTKCCTKKEGSYGYTYAISAETILKMAEEELLKRGVVQKPAWSEEDTDMLNCCISSIEEAKENRYAYKETDGDTSYDREIDWLKSLRPSWKPSEEHLSALLAVFNDPDNIGSQTCQLALIDLYEQLKKLM